MDAKARKLYMLPPASLSREEKIYLRDAIREAIKSAESLLTSVQREHPFWYYQPTPGTISEEARNFLLRHIDADEIPQKLQGGLDFHLSGKPTRVISGGNQSGKSFASAIDNLIVATGRVPYCFDETKPNFYKGWKIPASRLQRSGPVHVRVIGFDWENDVVKNLLPKYRELAPKEFLTDGSFDKSYVSGESTLYLRDGNELLGTIEFMSNKQDLTSFGGPPRRRVCFDEEPYESVYKENVMRMSTSENFEVVFSYTPINGMTWTYEALRERFEAGEPSIDWFQISTVSNPKANLKSLDEAMKAHDKGEKKTKLLGEYVSASGLVYGSKFQRDLHVIPAIETGCTCGNTDEHLNACPFTQYLGYLGIDAHMVKASVAALCFTDREDNFYVDTCYKKEANTDEFKADLNELIKGKRMDWAVFDPSNDSSITAFGGLNIFDLVSHGLKKSDGRRLRAFKGEKYQGSIAAGVDVIKKRLQLRGPDGQQRPAFFIFDRPENQGLIKQMRTLQKDSVNNPEAKGQPDRIKEGLADEHAAVRYINQNKLVFKAYRPYEPQPEVPDAEAMLA